MKFSKRVQNPDRMVKGLEDDVNVAKPYNSTLWEIARKNKLQRMFDRGQTTLTDHMTILSQQTLDEFDSKARSGLNDSKRADYVSFSQKSVQSSFTTKGGDKLMQEHDALDLETGEIPTNDTLQGEVSEIRTGTREELMDNFDPEDSPEWAEAEDELVQLVIEVEYKGDTIQHTQSMAYYDEPDPRSDLGAFIRRYGSPEQGQSVNVDYDADGNSELVLPN